MPSPPTTPAIRTVEKNRLAWSGPSERVRYSGGSDPSLATSSCRRDLWSRRSRCSAVWARSRADQALDEVVGVRRATVDVHRAEHRLEGVGQDRRLLPPTRPVLAAPEQEELAETEGLGHVGQREGVDHALAHAGQRALGQLTEPAVGEVGDDPPEDGVAQELQPLVADGARVLGAPRSVSHRSRQQVRVVELVPDALGEELEGQPPSRVRACT